MSTAGPAGSDEVVATSLRAVIGLVVAMVVVAVASGVWLTFAYRPGEVGWLRTLHSGSSAAAVISAIAAWVVQQRGCLRVTARGVGVALGLTIVVGGAFATGSSLAWEGGTASDRGVFVESGHGLTVDGRVIDAGDLVVSFVIHVALALCLLGALAWQYRRARCRPRLEPPARR